MVQKFLLGDGEVASRVLKVIKVGEIVIVANLHSKIVSPNLVATLDQGVFLHLVGQERLCHVEPVRDVLVLAGGTGEEDPALLLATVADDVALAAAEQQADLEQKKSFHKHYLINYKRMAFLLCAGHEKMLKRRLQKMEVKSGSRRKFEEGT